MTTGTVHPIRYVRVMSPPRQLPVWPLVALIGGLPVWWVLGLLPFVPIIFGLIALAYFVTQEQLHLVAGTVPLVAFLAWAAACIVMVEQPLRATGFAMRWSGLAMVLAIIVIITNTTTTLSDRRVLKLMLVPWALILAGGYLALIWPNGTFTTPIGRVLPGSLLSNELVRGLVVPRFAEVQQPFGAVEPFNRPSAPFPYANSWGAAFAYLLPLVLALLPRLSRRGKLLVGASVVLAIPPMIASSNRGMLVILTIAVLYVLARRIQWRQTRAALATAAVVVVAAAVFVAGGGINQIAARQDVSRTNEGRAEVYSATFRETLQSPLLGYGAPRANEEIGIALGTQGAAWMYMFSYGFVGLAFFLVFLGDTVIRGGRRLPPHQVWIHATLVGALAGVWFYGLDVVHLAILAVAAGLVLRRAATPPLLQPLVRGRL